jgi:plasmid stability protein
MAKTIQISSVPDDLHRKLKARAASEGVSLSDYLLNELRMIAERPTLSEWCDRLAKRRPVNPKISPARAIRDERGPI